MADENQAQQVNEDTSFHFNSYETRQNITPLFKVRARSAQSETPESHSYRRPWTLSSPLSNRSGSTGNSKLSMSRNSSIRDRENYELDEFSYSDDIGLGFDSSDEENKPLSIPSPQDSIQRSNLSDIQSPVLKSLKGLTIKSPLDAYRYQSDEQHSSFSSSPQPSSTFLARSLTPSRNGRTDTPSQPRVNGSFQNSVNSDSSLDVMISSVDVSSPTRPSRAPSAGDPPYDLSSSHLKSSNMSDSGSTLNQGVSNMGATSNDISRISASSTSGGIYDALSSSGSIQNTTNNDETHRALDNISSAPSSTLSAVSRIYSHSPSQIDYSDLNALPDDLTANAHVNSSFNPPKPERTNTLDSLSSIESDLREFETFQPENISQHQDHTPFRNNKANISVDESPSLVVGAKQEKAHIEELNKQNYELKLRILLMENAVSLSSGDNVIQLTRQLVDARSSLAEMTKDNKKLRQTIERLESKCERNIKNKDERIAELESNLDYLKSEYNKLHDESIILEDSRAADEETERIFDKYEMLLREEREKSFSLMKRINTLEDTLADAENILAENETLKESLNARNPQSELSGRGSSYRNHSPSSVSPRELAHIIKQVDAIKQALNTDTPSRSQSRRSTRYSSPTLFDESRNTVELFTNLLRQIQETANNYSASYAALQQDRDALEQEYVELDQQLQAVTDELKYNERLQEDDENRLEKLQEALQQAEAELDDLLDEREQLHMHVRTLDEELEGLQDSHNIPKEISENPDDAREIEVLKATITDLTLQIQQHETELQQSMEAAEKDSQTVREVLEILRQRFSEETNDLNLCLVSYKSISHFIHDLTPSA